MVVVRVQTPVPRFRYRVDGRPAPGVTDVLSDLGVSADYSMVRPDVLAAAMARGTRVHAAAERLLLGRRRPDADLEPGDEGYYAAVVAWAEDRQPVDVAVEQEVSVTGRHPYGGRFDVEHGARGRRRLDDFKCCSHHPRAHPLQTGAYAFARATQDPNLLTMPRGVIELRPNGTYKVHHHKNPGDPLAFVRLVERWWCEVGVHRQEHD